MALRDGLTSLLSPASVVKSTAIAGTCDDIDLIVENLDHTAVLAKFDLTHAAAESLHVRRRAICSRSAMSDPGRRANFAEDLKMLVPPAWHVHAHD